LSNPTAIFFDATGSTGARAGARLLIARECAGAGLRPGDFMRRQNQLADIVGRES
jgi:hypothetical protein